MPHNRTCGGKTGESGAAANTTDTVSSTAGDGAGDGETETETEDPEAALFQITKEENGGKTFTILTSDQCNYEFLADELTGELLNDAVYNRNLAVEIAEIVETVETAETAEIVEIVEIAEIAEIVEIAHSYR